MRRLGAGAWAAVAAAPVAVLVAVYGLRDHYRFADEAVGIFGGRQLQADFLSSIVDPQFSSRPLERLLAVLWAGVLEVAPSSAGAFQLFHVLLALVAASAAIPVALLLRGLGVRTLWAVAGGVIAISGPWAIFGMTLLNNAPGMTSIAWLLVAMQRAVRVPGWRSDALFCAAALLVGVTRAGNLPLAVAVAPALLWGAWARTGAPVAFVREMVRRHWILLGLGVVVAGVLAVRGFDGVFGTYGAGRSTYLPWDLLGPGIRTLGGHLAVATGLIGFAFAVPWIARGVVRPAVGGMTPERSFALIAVSMAAVFTYVYAPALNEDRYFLVLTPLVVVAFVHAITTRTLGLGWLAAGVALLGFFLVRGTDWPSSPDAYIQVPAAQWWNRVVEGRLSFLPVDQELAAVVLVLALVIAAGLAVGRRDSPLFPRALVLGGVLVVQALGSFYVLERWSQERGRPGLTFAQQTFADRATPGTEPAMLLRTNPAGIPELPFSWDDVAFWNQEVAGTLDVKPQPPCCYGGNFPLVWDERGQVQTGLLGRHVVTPLAAGASLVGETVAVERTQGYSVVRVAEPARMAFAVDRQTPAKVALHVWPRNLGTGARCLTGLLGDVTLAALDDGTLPIRRDGTRGTIELPDAQRLELDLLHPPGKPPSELRLTRC